MQFSRRCSLAPYTSALVFDVFNERMQLGQDLMSLRVIEKNLGVVTAKGVSTARNRPVSYQRAQVRGPRAACHVVPRCAIPMRLPARFSRYAKALASLRKASAWTSP